MSSEVDETSVKPETKRELKPKLRFPEFRDGPGWEEKTIGGVFNFSKKPEKATSFDSAKIITVKLHTLGVVKNERTGTLTGGANYFKRHAGEFIFSKIDLLNGAFGLVPNEMDGFYSSSDVPAFAFKSESSPIFFLNWLKASYLKLKVERTGTSNTLKRVSPEKFFQVPIQLPNIQEQQKVADCLSSTDELLAVQSQKLETLQAHKKGLMQQLFPAEGETVPKLRFPEFRGGLEWEEKRIEDLATRGSGHTPNKSHASYYNGGINWVSLADSNKLDNRYIYETKIEISEEGLKNSSAVLHHPGTVIISRDAGVGKSAILHGAMAVSQHFMAWRCNEHRLSNWFLYYVLQLSKPKFESVATGSTIKTIGLPYFKELRITVPSLAEQQKIADCLSSIDDLIAAQKQKIESLRVHKKGLMQQLFPSPDGVHG